MTRDAIRIVQVRADVRFYRESLTAMLGSTDNRPLIALIESTLQAVSRLEADPLLYARHDRRRPELVSRWLAAVEERLHLVAADYKILHHWLEYQHFAPATRSAEQGFIRLDAALVRFLDRLCGDANRVFFAGLLLIFSPVITACFFQPYTVLYLMCSGLCCAVGGLLVGQPIKAAKPANIEAYSRS